MRFYGCRARSGGGVTMKLRTLAGNLRRVTVELRRGRSVAARSTAMELSTKQWTLVLKRARNRRFIEGTYSLVVKAGKQVVLRRTARVGRPGNRS